VQIRLDAQSKHIKLIEKHISASEVCEL